MLAQAIVVQRGARHAEAVDQFFHCFAFRDERLCSGNIIGGEGRATATVIAVTTSSGKSGNGAFANDASFELGEGCEDVKDEFAASR